MATQLAIAGVALGAPPVLDILVDLCENIWERSKSLTDLDPATKSRYQVSLDTCRARVSNAINIAEEFSKVMNDQQNSLLSRVIQQLRSTLEHMVQTLDKASNSQETIRKLEELLGSLRQWLQDFDGLILAFTRTLQLNNNNTNHLQPLNRVDALIKASGPESSSISESPMPKHNDLQNVPYTEIFKPIQYDIDRSLIEYRGLSADNTSAKTLANVSRILQSVNPLEMNILSCRCYGEGKLLFDVPPGFGDPISLRGLLLQEKGKPRHPLNERVQLLRQLATALLYLHASGLVHHAVRPDCILLLPVTAVGEQILTSGEGDQQNHQQQLQSDMSKGKQKMNQINEEPLHNADPGPSHKNKVQKLGQAFLMGYQWTRNEDGRSERMGNQVPEESLYRTTDRQGEEQYKRYYSYLDDVYSFGVVALEIALWKSFFVDDQKTESPETKSQWKVKPREGLPTAEPMLLRQYLIDQARTEVPRRMGQKLSDLIVSCLSCLPRDESNTALEMLGKVEKDAMSHILTTLHEINI